MSSYQTIISENHLKAFLRKHIFSTCGKRTPRRTPLSASLTLEAALALPLVLFSMVLLMTPFRIMDASRKMQGICDGICMDVSKYAYSLCRIDLPGSGSAEAEKDEDEEGSFVSLMGSGVLGGYAAARAQAAADDEGLQVVSFLDTQCMVEDDLVTIKLDYLYRLPFPVFGLGAVRQSVVSSRRAWVGAEGSKGRGAEGKTEEEDPWVYVGETSTRYHLSAGCHYLSNDLSAVSLDRARAARNASGGKYYPCARCARSAAAGQTVYIMPNGSSYHTDPDCSAIIAYVRTVRLSEVEHLGACSYCGH